MPLGDVWFYTKVISLKLRVAALSLTVFIK